MEIVQLKKIIDFIVRLSDACRYIAGINSVPNKYRCHFFAWKISSPNISGIDITVNLFILIFERTVEFENAMLAIVKNVIKGITINLELTRSIDAKGIPDLGTSWYTSPSDRTSSRKEEITHQLGTTLILCL